MPAEFPSSALRRSLVLAASLLLISCGGGGGGSNGIPLTAIAPASAPSPYLSAQVGDVLAVKLEQLHPTQPAVGYDQIYAQLGRKQPDPNRYQPVNGYQGNSATDNYSRYMYQSDRKRLDDYCFDSGRTGVDDASYKPLQGKMNDPATFACVGATPTSGSPGAAKLKTVVVGPGGVLYLTDGHHTMTVMHDLDDGGPELAVWVRVAANLSDMTDPASFWAEMQKRNFAWLRNPDQSAVSPADLPAEVGLAHMKNDSFRSLTSFTRDMAYNGSNLTDAEFTEFYWASGLIQRNFNLAGYNLSDLAPSHVMLQNGTVAADPSTSGSSYLAAARDAALLMVAIPPNEPVADGRLPAALGQLPAPASAAGVSGWNSVLDNELARSDVDGAGLVQPGGRLWYATRYKICGGPASTRPSCWLQHN